MWSPSSCAQTDRHRCLMPSHVQLEVRSTVLRVLDASLVYMEGPPISARNDCRDEGYEGTTGLRAIEQGA